MIDETSVAPEVKFRYLFFKVLAMPTIVLEGYKFRFYSSDLYEPPHMHVLRGDKAAKIWLQPVAVEYNHGYNSSELNRILRLTRKNQNSLLETWNAYFSK